MPEIRLTVSDDIMNTLKMEADVSGITVAELLRRGAGTFIMVEQIKRDVAAHFENPDTVTMGAVIVAASADSPEVAREFAITPPDFSNSTAAPLGSLVREITDED